MKEKENENDKEEQQLKPEKADYMAMIIAMFQLLAPIAVVMLIVFALFIWGFTSYF